MRTPCHIGIATRSLDEAMEQLAATLAVRWQRQALELHEPLATAAGVVDWELRTILSARAPMRVELLEGGPGSTWHTPELATLHHYAYWSDDLAADTGQLVDEGWSVEVTFPSEDGTPRGFAYLTRDSSPRIELIARG